jgi:hypothetical protein
MKKKDLFGFLGTTTQSKIFSLVMIALIITLAYFGIKKIIQFIKSQNIRERNQLNELESSGMKLTYPDSSYNEMALRIYNAMKGVGTDDNAVFDVLNRLSNKADWLKLQIAFGTRDDETLIEWLHGEFHLSSGKSKINNILQSKGVEPIF